MAYLLMGTVIALAAFAGRAGGQEPTTVGEDFTDRYNRVVHFKAWLHGSAEVGGKLAVFHVHEYTMTTPRGVGTYRGFYVWLDKPARHVIVSGRAGVTLTPDGFKWGGLATWNKTWKDGRATITVRRVENRVLVDLTMPIAGVALRDVQVQEVPDAQNVLTGEPRRLFYSDAP